MDRITQALLDHFKKTHEYDDLDDASVFERFASYCCVSRHYEETFSADTLATDGGGDLGIDAIAIIVNGTLVTSSEEIDDLCEANKSLDVDFVFCQAKSGKKFQGAHIATFITGVSDFFSESPQMPRNEAIEEYANLQQQLFGNSVKMTERNPNCFLYYVAAGEWKDDATVQSRIDKELDHLRAMNLFGEVRCIPVDAKELQSFHKATQRAVSTEITIDPAMVLPEIQGLKEAYLGYLPVKEYLKLLQDDAGHIRKVLFHDNIRDFQGDNDVNREIATSIHKGNQDRFIVLNNGITVVARTLNRVGKKFRIEDYQIVNGCQTSHVLFNARDAVDEQAHIVVKLIVTDNEDVTNSIITATNRQTSIRPEDIESLSEFQRTLEDYYAAVSGPGRLYYERRSRQYAHMDTVEKSRVIPISAQLRVFVSMFLDEPHSAGRYPKKLLERVRDRVFRSNHRPAAYYTSALANYKLDSLLANNVIERRYRPFRYQMLLILRCQLGGSKRPSLDSSKLDAYCDKLDQSLIDHPKASAAFTNTLAVIDKAIETKGLPFNRDTPRAQGFTEAVLECL